MKPAKIDVAVLFIFFTRKEKTAAVFEQIKKHDQHGYIFIKMARELIAPTMLRILRHAEKLLKILIGNVKYTVCIGIRIMDVTLLSLFPKNGCSQQKQRV